jgi:hypothetical protein
MIAQQSFINETQPDADRKSKGCLTCHGGIEECRRDE